MYLEKPKRLIIWNAGIQTVNVDINELPIQ